MVLFSCCRSTPVQPPAATDENPENAEKEEPAALGLGCSKIDFLRTPESFTMQRIAAGLHTRNSNKILQGPAKSSIELAVRSCGLFLGDTSRPPRTLLEASSRRIAQRMVDKAEAEKQEEQVYSSGVCQAFTDAYVEALKTKNAKWASGTDVAALFLVDAKLVTHDKQSFVGSTAIIRRLNAGMEQLLKMADQSDTASASSEAADKSISEAITITEPEEKSEGVWVSTYVVKWGIRKFKFQDEFTIKDSKIKKLRRMRL
ncbi:hypothetical protein BSKO_09262 [Bryopsis sp. KO-2023]|nr:hypothetical protein BSKO_09262 [Bryopsis sp. KO-2023]